MVLREVADLKMAVEGNPIGVYGARGQMPSTLMGVYHLARKAFVEAQEYMASWEKYESERDDDEDATVHPLTHYGVFKHANEGTALVYANDDGVASVGLRWITAKVKTNLATSEQSRVERSTAN